VGGNTEGLLTIAEVSNCYGLHLKEVKTGRKAGRLVVVGCRKTEG